ncbi:major facilitator superfamily domain-containing protein [Aspergillus lucknowensis]|uniref:Major facilitator superfamily domain-containing protein n=1 Tax=Aspergillus lucknowensis TaxID=176173 RepID=A0ABR4M4X2_9EURO
MEKSPEDIEQPSPAAGAEVGPSPYITGWKLAVLLLGVSIAIFLPNLEVSIVSTALVTIANDLQGFSKTGWVVVAYLVNYTGFIIIWAKLSDILTRKWSLIASLVIFIIGSAICGASQSMTMLIVFRALQGLGGAGCFSISMVVFFELIPPDKYPKYGSLLSADVALATLLGPIIGGAIADGTTWRWVFLINLPIGALAVVALGVFLPNRFPRHHDHSTPSGDNKHSLRRVDFVGTLLLVGASLLLVTGLLEATTEYSWSSALPITLFVVSAVLWVSFVAWEYFATKETWAVEPVFPFRFFPNRYWMGMLLQAFFLGVPFTMLVIALPQRFQTVNSLSALDAGVRLLPYAMLAPVGSLVSNIIFMRRRVPILLLIAGATFQVLGLALLVAEPVRESLPARLYGFEILAGFGVGITFGTLVTITPGSVEPRDLATATGAMIQFRQMGSTIGLSIGSSLLNSYLKSHLAPPVLSAAQLSALLENIRVIFTFPPELQRVTRDAFAAAFELQLKVVVGLAAALFPSILLMLRVARREGRLVPAVTGAR